MADLFEPIVSPAEIALPYAEQIGSREVFGALPDEESVLVLLDEISTMAQAEGSYFVEAGRALSIPASFDRDKDLTYGSFYNLQFEGPFRTYSIVSVGRIVGAYSVRSLCLTFDEATLLPYFDSLPDDHLLHVPVLAVQSMSRTGMPEE